MNEDDERADLVEWLVSRHLDRSDYRDKLNTLTLKSIRTVAEIQRLCDSGVTVHVTFARSNDLKNGITTITAEG